MKMRAFGPGGRPVSEIGLGTWQLGGSEWGDVPEEAAIKTLHAAADAGTTFIDTADIYGLGRSERLIGRFLKERSDPQRFFVATKLGRSPDPGWPENFSAATLRRHTEASLERLGVESIDLTQTHCIPAEQMEQGNVLRHLQALQDEGLIKAFGASVESVSDALACLEFEGLASLQVIFNIFRQKLVDDLFGKAKQRGVAIIVRLPLASGLLSGKFKKTTTFGKADHRNFNRDGQAFNVGETFAGLPFEEGVQLAEQLRPLVPSGMTMAQFALRWCLDFDAVTTVIPGATRPEQALQNTAASDMSSLPAEVHHRLAEFYRQRVADRIRGKY